ncbi:GntR family transcriptional regulator [Cytobacillus gottheilii]|uniref:GntR family transcriptional regulator n=1 Tax=Cytobacillus gottheilii TaxID=859144 RepID=UPI003CF4EE2D
MSHEKPDVQIDGPVPLYEQIKAGIKEYVKKHDLKAGQKIPNESELCDLFDVSRITIRRAIKELVEEGFIEIIRGKGTFVKIAKKDLHLLNLKGFTEGLSTGEKENNIQKEIKYKEIIEDTSEIAKAFGTGHTSFLKLIRVVKDSHGPFSVDFAYFPTNLYPGIESKITDDTSTFAIIREHYHIKFTKVEKEIEYNLPTQEICTYLGISKTTPVILVKKVIYGTYGTPVHYSRYYLIGERVKFYIDAEYDVSQ